MIPRVLEPVLLDRLKQNPVVTLTGPRQSGKTTLCQMALQGWSYVNLEPLDRRAFAREDPRGFLDGLGPQLILDEIQRVPELLSYIQERVDQDQSHGQYVLTGSERLSITQSVTQTLAGRTAILHLLPLELSELRNTDGYGHDLWRTMLTGGYPRIYDRHLSATPWLLDYITTYVERDVRQIRSIENLDQFRSFLALTAGRVAREVNLSSLGKDAGVTHNTARSWMSVLQAGFILFQAGAMHRNVRKQLVKAPKMHFFDSGLVCALLNLTSEDQLRTHPLRGAIFESWVAAEIAKRLSHTGQPANVWHYRESRGAEIDIVFETGDARYLIECKSGATIQPPMLRNLRRFGEQIQADPSGKPTRLVVVYGGDESMKMHDIEIMPWHKVDQLVG